jgi:hypothetical protein
VPFEAIATQYEAHRGPSMTTNAAVEALRLKPDAYKLFD